MLVCNDVDWQWVALNCRCPEQCQQTLGVMLLFQYSNHRRMQRSASLCKREVGKAPRVTTFMYVDTTAQSCATGLRCSEGSKESHAVCMTGPSLLVASHVVSLWETVLISTARVK